MNYTNIHNGFAALRKAISERSPYIPPKTPANNKHSTAKKRNDENSYGKVSQETQWREEAGSQAPVKHFEEEAPVERRPPQQPQPRVFKKAIAPKSYSQIKSKPISQVQSGMEEEDVNNEENEDDEEIVEEFKSAPVAKETHAAQQRFFESSIMNMTNKRKNPDGWVHTPGWQGNPGVNLDPKYVGVLQPHFVLYLVGKPGCGKTFILEEMLMNKALYGGKFDEILYYTPYPLPTMEMTKGVNWHSEISPETLAQKIDSISNRNPNANVCVVIDDLISQLDQLCNDKIIRELFYNRRKTIPGGTISYIITGQKYKLFPHTFRTVLTGILVFKVQGNEWKQIMDENVFLNDFRQAKVIIDNHLRGGDGHNFIYLNLQTGDTWLNFRERLT